MGITREPRRRGVALHRRAAVPDAPTLGNRRTRSHRHQLARVASFRVIQPHLGPGFRGRGPKGHAMPQAFHLPQARP